MATRAPSQNLESDVLIPAIQNFVGGVGVALLVGLALLWLVAWPLAQVAQVAGTVGGAWFALWTAVRTCRDEVQWLIKLYADRRNNDEMKVLRKQTEYLMDRVEEINEEKDEIINGHIPSSADRIEQIARQLLKDYYNHGLSMSYAESQKRGISRGDWDHVHRMFVVAGIKDDAGHILIDDYTDAREAWYDTTDASNLWIKARDGSLVKGVRA